MVLEHFYNALQALAWKVIFPLVVDIQVKLVQLQVVKHIEIIQCVGVDLGNLVNRVDDVFFFDHMVSPSQFQRLFLSPALLLYDVLQRNNLALGMVQTLGDLGDRVNVSNKVHKRVVVVDGLVDHVLLSLGDVVDPVFKDFVLYMVCQLHVV